MGRDGYRAKDPSETVFGWGVFVVVMHSCSIHSHIHLFAGIP